MAVAEGGTRAPGLARVAAIFRRDALVALSYPGNFALSWLAIVIEVVVVWYISRLIPPSPKFGSTGVAVGYFQFVAINSAFVRFQSAALNSFAESIRDAQLTGTLEIVLATPTQLPTLVLSSAVWSFAFTSLQTALFLLIAIPFGLDLHHVNLITAAVFLVLTVGAVSPLGVLAASLSMVIKKTGPGGVHLERERPAVRRRLHPAADAARGPADRGLDVADHARAQRISRRRGRRSAQRRRLRCAVAARRVARADAVLAVGFCEVGSKSARRRHALDVLTQGVLRDPVGTYVPEQSGR